MNIMRKNQNSIIDTLLNLIFRGNDLYTAASNIYKL